MEVIKKIYIYLKHLYIIKNKLNKKIYKLFQINIKINKLYLNLLYKNNNLNHK